MALTAPPTAPTTSDPSSFESRADALVAWYETNVTELGALQTDVAAKESSVSSLVASALAAGLADAEDNATAAAASAASAASLFDQFDDKWLGAKTSDPTLDNDGNALTAGALYVNTTTGLVRFYTGSAWVQGIGAVSGVSTVNGAGGDVVVQPTLVSGTNIKMINGASILGSGDLSISSGKISAVAKGAIASAGMVVTLNTDGTVSVLAGSEAKVGAIEGFRGGAVAEVVSTYDSANGKVVIAFNDTSTAKGQAIVGTVSGTAISFGTLTAFSTSNVSDVSIGYDSTNSKVVIACRDEGVSNYGRAIVGTVSGTSISFGTAVTFVSAGYPRTTSVAFDSTNGKVVIAYKDPTTAYGKAVVGTVSGTSISFGTAAAFNSVSTYGISAAYDSTNGKVVVAYADGAGTYGACAVGTVSGTSISFGTPVTFSATAAQYIAAAFDSTHGKVVVAYAEGGSYVGTAKVGTVSGTTISFGSAVVFSSTQSTGISCRHLSATGKIVVAFANASSYGAANVGTVSGATVSFDPTTIFKSSTTSYLATATTGTKIVAAFCDNAFSSFGRGVVFTPDGLIVGDRIGISTAAAANGAAVDVTILGGVNESMSGLTTGATYYVLSDGSLTTAASTNPRIGRALSATKLLVTDGI